MTNRLAEAAYELRWDLDHFETYGLDWKFDLEIVPFPGSERTAFFDAARFKAPNPVLFKSFPDIACHIDYPYPDNRWSVMSQRMLDVLRAVGDFLHRTLPVAVVDWRTPEIEWYNGFGRLRRETTLRNFVAVQITEHLDVLDREKSIYTADATDPALLINVEKFVFKINEKPLPPIFRVKGYPVPLFISAAARTALKKAKISGPRYLSSNGFSGGADEIDVTVTIAGV